MSKALQQLAGVAVEEQFEAFLTSDRYNTKKPLQPKECRFYLRATRYCLEWFRRLENNPPENLSLTLLVPKVPQEEQQVKAAAKYVDSWLGRFLDSEKNPGDRQSQSLYRQGAMLKVIVAIAQFLYNDQINSPQETRDIPLIKILQHQLSKVVKEYKQHPPITDEEKKWQELSSPPKLIPSQHHAASKN